MRMRSAAGSSLQPGRRLPVAPAAVGRSRNRLRQLVVFSLAAQPVAVGPSLSGQDPGAERAGFGHPTVGDPHRAVGFDGHRRAVQRSRTGSGRASGSSGAGRRARARRATTSTGAVRPGVAVAPLVLGVEGARSTARSARGSAPGTGSRGPTRPRPPDLPNRRSSVPPVGTQERQNGTRRRWPRRPSPRRRGRQRIVQPVVIGRVGPGADELPLAGRAQQPDGGEDAGPGRDDHRRHVERLGQGAGVQRPGAAEGDQRQPGGSTPRSTVTARTACSMAASTTATTPGHATTSAWPPPSDPSGSLGSARARRRGRVGAQRLWRPAAARRRGLPSPGKAAPAGMRPSTRSASVTVGAVPPRP